MNQKERVIRYMNLYHSITPIEAFRDLGITKLATVIGLIKRDGKSIYQYYQKGKNRFGETCYFMRYWNNYQQYLHDLQDIVIEEEMIENATKRIY